MSSEYQHECMRVQLFLQVYRSVVADFPWKKKQVLDRPPVIALHQWDTAKPLQFPWRLEMQRTQLFLIPFQGRNLNPWRSCGTRASSTGRFCAIAVARWWTRAAAGWWWCREVVDLVDVLLMMMLTMDDDVDYGWCCCMFFLGDVDYAVYPIGFGHTFCIILSHQQLEVHVGRSSIVAD